ncbi:isopeptide-forming domain-containing fimbrial protein [Paenibacillus sp. NPDC093718]|uniref:isopeptide-forming domain-containing fimbrial protein n=1 Tax=Paenibacillus sp. NPDC093718 TaxID=3390601 RepID=UPI003CFFE0FE
MIFPEFDSSKIVSIEEKAAGNTDAAHPEVGDTLLYTIKARNTIADSTVKNLMVSDSVPSELEYVPGSLTVDGVSVTDAEGDDSGHYASSQVVGEFGDVSDMDCHTVQFKAVVQSGQASKEIINIATVNGDNVATPDRPRAEVEIYPRNPHVESEKFAANTNVTKATYEVGDTISYTIRVRGVVNDTYLENLTITDTLPAGLEYVPSTLKVDGVSVTDADDNDAGYSVTGQVYGSFGNVKDMNWHTLEFQAVIQAGEGGQTIQNTALVKGDNIDQPGTPTEKVIVEPEPPVEPPVVESGKLANDLNGGSIEVGDTIEYTIRARNTVSGSQVTNLVISDELPQELEYVTGTLKVDGVSVTDSADSDRGEYVNGKVKGSFGTVTDTAWHTLEFQAKVVNGKHGDIIKNVGVVNGDNLNVPNRPSEEVTINEPNPVGPAPALESGKEVKDLNGGTIQVGDVIEYTIRTRNTAPATSVTNLVIADELLNELKYVAGSLKVDGVSVTDAPDSDKGSYADGKVNGQFGNITDTAWHTIVFRAKLIAGQDGQTIRNVGEVTGDNLIDPDHPYEDIIIGGRSGSNPGIPGDTNDGSTDKPNPGFGDSDSESPDSSQSGGSNGSDDTDVAGDSEAPGQSGNSNDSANVESGYSKGTGNKLPDTATNMYNYLMAGCIIFFAGLFLLKRKKT